MVTNVIIDGTPLPLIPHAESKPWGGDPKKGISSFVPVKTGLIGEYWLSSTETGKSSQVLLPGRETPLLLSEVIRENPEAMLGRRVAAKYGTTPLLVKCLTPGQQSRISDLSRQVHDTKNELWVVARVIAPQPQIVLGFNPEKLALFRAGGRIDRGAFLEAYAKTLACFGLVLRQANDALIKAGLEESLRKTGNTSVLLETLVNTENAREWCSWLERLATAEGDIDAFYNYLPVSVGQIIQVPAGTVHALMRGVEVIEPQIGGRTLPLEDGARYPVRYSHGVDARGHLVSIENHEVNEIFRAISLDAPSSPAMMAPNVELGRFPGLEVSSIALSGNGDLEVDTKGEYHILTLLSGKVEVHTDTGSQGMANAQDDCVPASMFIPACAGAFRLHAFENSILIQARAPLDLPL